MAGRSGRGACAVAIGSPGGSAVLANAQTHVLPARGFSEDFTPVVRHDPPDPIQLAGLEEELERLAGW